MKQVRHQGDPANPLERHYQRDTAMVFGPILALVGYAGVLLLAVAASPPQYRAWTVGVGIAVAIVACFVYLFWAINASRHKG